MKFLRAPLFELPLLLDPLQPLPHRPVNPLLQALLAEGGLPVAQVDVRLRLVGLLLLLLLAVLLNLLLQEARITRVVLGNLLEKRALVAPERLCEPVAEFPELSQLA